MHYSIYEAKTSDLKKYHDYPAFGGIEIPRRLG